MGDPLEILSCPTIILIEQLYYSRGSRKPQIWDKAPQRAKTPRNALTPFGDLRQDASQNIYNILVLLIGNGWQIKPDSYAIL
jgi:hypothetical protein